MPTVAAEKPSSDLYIGPAPHGMAERVLTELDRQVSRALTYSFGAYTKQDLIEGVESNDMQLWNAVKDGKVIGIEVTQIIQFPRKKVCNLLLTAGSDLGLWGGELLELIESFAKSQGCDLITGQGRKGWLKIASGFGFNKQYMAAAKVI